VEKLKIGNYVNEDINNICTCWFWFFILYKWANWCFVKLTYIFSKFNLGCRKKKVNNMHHCRSLIKLFQETSSITHIISKWRSTVKCECFEWSTKIHLWMKLDGIMCYLCMFYLVSAYVTWLWHAVVCVKYVVLCWRREGLWFSNGRKGILDPELRGQLLIR
jgi:hypothetical protein